VIAVLYGLAGDERDAAQGAFELLFPLENQSLFREGFPDQLLLATFGPIGALRRIVGRRLPSDFLEAGDRGLVELHQFGFSGSKRPVAVVQEVARLHPVTRSLWVSAFRPSPEHLPVPVSDLVESLAGADVSVVIRPSPDNWVKFLDYLAGRGLLVRPQIGLDPLQVLQDLLFLGDDDRLLPAPEGPDRVPQEVEPLVDVDDAGVCFAECQARISEEFLDAGRTCVSRISRVGAVTTKSFYGTSDNAVRIQVWIAISVYVLVAIVKKELGVDRSLSEIFQIVSLTLFEKTPIFQALTEQEPQDPGQPFPNQLNLFDL
jgi:hypothetical protein